MAKFLMDDGTIFTTDKYTCKREEPIISPTLIAQLEMIDTLKIISKNLTNETLNKDCIMQLIKGTQCECKLDHNCEKCICQWYMNKS